MLLLFNPVQQLMNVGRVLDVLVLVAVDKFVHFTKKRPADGRRNGRFRQTFGMFFVQRLIDGTD